VQCLSSSQYIPSAIASKEKLFDVTLRMIHPTQGVKIGDHKYRFKTYKDCFVASQLVSWMHSTLNLDPNEAVAIGVQLEAANFIGSAKGSEKSAFGNNDGLYIVNREKLLAHCDKQHIGDGGGQTKQIVYEPTTMESAKATGFSYPKV
jgi:hypothetical protein